MSRRRQDAKHLMTQILVQKGISTHKASCIVGISPKTVYNNSCNIGISNIRKACHNIVEARANSLVITRKIRRALVSSKQSSVRHGGLPCITAYTTILRTWTGKCFCCGVEGITILMLDHCHKTGDFRGWLCHGCNSALGHAKDNPQLLRTLADYLEKHQMQEDDK
jgi:hypothetical protein